MNRSLANRIGCSRRGSGIAHVCPVRHNTDTQMQEEREGETRGYCSSGDEEDATLEVFLVEVVFWPQTEQAKTNSCTAFSMEGHQKHRCRKATVQFTL